MRVMMRAPGTPRVVRAVRGGGGVHVGSGPPMEIGPTRCRGIAPPTVDASDTSTRPGVTRTTPTPRRRASRTPRTLAVSGRGSRTAALLGDMLELGDAAAIDTDALRDASPRLRRCGVAAALRRRVGNAGVRKGEMLMVCSRARTRRRYGGRYDAATREGTVTPSRKPGWGRNSHLEGRNRTSGRGFIAAVDCQMRR